MLGGPAAWITINDVLCILSGTKEKLVENPKSANSSKIKECTEIGQALYVHGGSSCRKLTASNAGRKEKSKTLSKLQ